MKMISVNGVTRMVPQRLDELSADELTWLIRKVGQGLDATSIKLQFAARYWKLPANSINRLGRKLRIEKNLLQKLIYNENWLEINSKVYLLAEQFNFLATDRNLEKNPFPVVRFPWHRFRMPLYGPSDGLKNMSIWEFALAENAANIFLHDEDEQHLNRLVAILYRRASAFKLIKSWFYHVADIRQTFNDQTITQRIPVVQQIPLETKIAISMFFNSVRASFKNTDRFPRIYKEAEKKSSGKDLSWADVIMELSGEIPGNEEKTGQVNLYTFLYRLELNAIKAEEMKKQQEEITKKSKR